MYLESIKQQLTAMNKTSPSDLIGCTLEEIIQLELDLKIELPIAYREFLRIMGKGAGKFLRGSDCFYSDLKDLQTGAVELLDENQFPQTLPKDAFVFLMHQGYQFSFFRLSEGENPPIYFYCEGETKESFVKTHRQFTDFLATELDLHHQYLMIEPVKSNLF